jgi:hypothetical protein
MNGLGLEDAKNLVFLFVFVLGAIADAISAPARLT